MKCEILATMKATKANLITQAELDDIQNLIENGKTNEIYDKMETVPLTVSYDMDSRKERVGYCLVPYPVTDILPDVERVPSQKWEFSKLL